MRKGRELIGLPVIDWKTGKETGSVEDLIVDLSQDKVTALSVRSDGWLTNRRLIPLKQIQQINKQAVIVNEENTDAQLAVDPGSELGVKSLKGISVFGCEGRDLGTVEDLVLSLPDGRITGWEISDGLVQDLVDGRRVLPVEAVVARSTERFVAQEGGW